MNKNFLYTLLVFAIIDVATDIAFLAALADKQDEDTDTDKHPLIGRRYVVKDNSYAIDKESGVSVGNLYDKEYVIVSDPYVEEVEFFGTTNKHLFVDVFSIDSARKYRVLFQENCVVAE